MRRTLLAGLAGLALTAPLAPPAHAEGAIVLVCDLHYDGNGTGGGSCNLTGVIQLQPYVAQPVGVSFGYQDGIACGLRNVGGVIFGPFPPIGFTWTKIGPIGAMTLSGPVNGGTYTESVPIVGSPCWPSAETTTADPVGT